MRRRPVGVGGFVLAGLIMAASNSGAQNCAGLCGAVTTPVEPTTHSRTDQGEQRVEVLDGGALIEAFNLGPGDSLTIVVDKGIQAPRSTEAAAAA